MLIIKMEYKVRNFRFPLFFSKKPNRKVGLFCVPTSITFQVELIDDCFLVTLVCKHFYYSSKICIFVASKLDSVVIVTK